jgi:hypothetical protein
VAFQFKYVLPEDRRDDSKKQSRAKASKRRREDGSEDEETSNEETIPTKKQVKASTPGIDVEGAQRELEETTPKSKTPDTGSILSSSEKEPNPSTSPEDSAPANEDQVSSDKPPLTVEVQDHVAPLGPERFACR